MTDGEKRPKTTEVKKETTGSSEVKKSLFGTKENFVSVQKGGNEVLWGFPLVPRSLRTSDFYSSRTQISRGCNHPRGFGTDISVIHCTGTVVEVVHISL